MEALVKSTLVISFLVLVFIAHSCAGDMCRTHGTTYTYCRFGCCGSDNRYQYCCGYLSGYSVAGIVVGCAAFVFLVAAIACCFCYKHKKREAVIRQSPTVTVINGPSPYVTTYNLPPGYAAGYHPSYGPGQTGYYGAPPVYGTPNAPPPAYTADGHGFKSVLPVTAYDPTASSSTRNA